MERTILKMGSMNVSFPIRILICFLSNSDNGLGQFIFKNCLYKNNGYHYLNGHISMGDHHIP